jgi:hypothetical protein
MNLCDVTCSVVAYHTEPAMLRRALSSVLSSKLRVKVFVIDNSATPVLKGVVENSGAEYVFTGENLGFGRGHNFAIQRATQGSRFHLVLNPDVYFEPSVIEMLYRLMNVNPSFGLISPRVLFPDGRMQYTCRLLPTPFDLFARRFLPQAVRNLFSARLERAECKILDLDKALSVPFVHGCFLFLRSDALREVGGFDDRIFLYMEDMDLCRRIRARFKVIYFPAVSVYHEFEKGSYSSRKLVAAHIRSAFYYFQKWGWFFDAFRRTINRETLEQEGENCEEMLNAAKIGLPS